MLFRELRDLYLLPSQSCIMIYHLLIIWGFSLLKDCTFSVHGNSAYILSQYLLMCDFYSLRIWLFFLYCMQLVLGFENSVIKFPCARFFTYVAFFSSSFQLFEVKGEKGHSFLQMENQKM